MVERATKLIAEKYADPERLRRATADPDTGRFDPQRASLDPIATGLLAFLAVDRGDH